VILGRKEIITFFYIYLALTICSLVIDAGVVPPRSDPFPYFVAVQSGLTSALCACLLVNGFVGFQLYEDGTALSVWLVRISSVATFAMTFVIALLTFKSWGGLGPSNTIGLFVVLYLLNAIAVAIYVVMQLLLVANTLDDRWPLGHILFGLLVFIIGQVLLYAFSDTICNNVQHYLDGLFFATFCNLLAVMMVYKVRLTEERRRASSADKALVLGFDYQGRLGILGWRQAKHLGSQGTASRGGPTPNRLPRHQLRICRQHVPPPSVGNWSQQLLATSLSCSVNVPMDMTMFLAFSL
jgi:hypothetical protein